MIRGKAEVVEAPVVARSGAGRRIQPASSLDADARLRVRAAFGVARRELSAAVHGPSLYMMVTLGCLVAAAVVKSYLDFVSDSGTLVLADPLNGPLLFAILATTGYLGLVAAAGLAGERERGTLEVLFYGPVDSSAVIVGKLLGLLLTYASAIGALTAFLALMAWLTGFPLGGQAVALLAASIIPAASMVALGLLLAALVGRVRSALALTTLAIAVFVAVDVGDRIAATAPADSLMGSAAGLLSSLAILVGWVSPFSYLWRAGESFALGSVVGGSIALGVAIIYSVVLSALAVLALRWRGVQRWRE